MGKPFQPAMYYIYHLASGTFYIGSAISISERIKNHIYELNKGIHHNSRFQKLYNENNKIQVQITPTLTREEAYALEQKHVDVHRDNPLLLNKGFDVRKPALGNKWSDESRERFSNIKRGTSNHQLGLKRTEEQKQRMRSAALRRAPISDETKQKMREAGLRRAPPTNETCEKLSRSAMGNAYSGVPVMIQGIKYAHAKEAAIALEMPHPSVMYRLKSKSKRFADWRQIGRDVDLSLLENSST